jgi:hypothetical protein
MCDESAFADIITSWHIPPAFFIGWRLRAGALAAAADAILAGLLMFWIYVSKREFDSMIS